MENQKRSQIKLYFTSFPQWTLAAAAVGAIITMAADGPVGYIVGIGTILLAGALGLRWLATRPSGPQMDTWLREDIQALEPRALSKAGLEKEDLVREQVVVIGPRFRNLAGATFGFRRDADKKARFTPVHVTIINFTEHQLVAYQCALDCMTGKPLNECVSEYFYNDIVAVSTQSEAFTYSISDLDQRLVSRVPKLTESAVNGQIQVNDGETFILSTSGEASVRVELNDPVIIRELGGGDLPLEWAENAVQAVRKMLREKKSGALPMRASGI
ncbi:MAG TPA: hypothetical protein VH394_20145 [Thermoanaerobaculia bacterium]|jgi:hypothetical protein|nr:hypothetical protein [Thermoanaerobaculia bacterium]